MSRCVLIHYTLTKREFTGIRRALAAAAAEDKRMTVLRKRSPRISALEKSPRPLRASSSRSERLDAGKMPGFYPAEKLFSMTLAEGKEVLQTRFTNSGLLKAAREFRGGPDFPGIELKNCFGIGQHSASQNYAHIRRRRVAACTCLGDFACEAGWYGLKTRSSHSFLHFQRAPPLRPLFA